MLLSFLHRSAHQDELHGPGGSHPGVEESPAWDSTPVLATVGRREHPGLEG